MKRTSKAAALRSLKRVHAKLLAELEYRKIYAPLGSPEMGVIIGLQDGCTAVADEIRRVKKLRLT